MRVIQKQSKKHMRRALVCVTVVAAFFLAMAGHAGWKIYRGSFSPQYLSGVLESMLIPDDSTLTLSAGDISIYWDAAARAPVLDAADIRLLSPQQDTAISIDHVTVRFSLAALWRGRLNPSHIDVQHPNARLTRAENGTMTLSSSSPSAVTRGGLNVEKNNELIANIVFSPLLLLQKNHRLEHFEELKIDQVEVAIDDKFAGALWQVEQAAFMLNKVDGQIVGQFAIDLDLAGEKTKLDGEMSFNEDKDMADIRLLVKDVSSQRLAQFHPALFNYIPADTTFSGHIRSQFAVATVNGVPDLQPQTIALTLEAGQGTLKPNAFLKYAIPFQRIFFTAGYNASGQSLELKDLMIDLGTTKIQADAKINEDRTFNFTARVNQVLFDDLKHLWPDDLVPNARHWVVSNISRGNANVTFVQKGVLTDTGMNVTDMHGDIVFENLRATYFKSFPAFENIKGTATFNDRDFIIRATEGQGQGMALLNAEVKLLDLAADLPRAEIAVKVKTTLGDAVAFSDRDPLHAGSFFDGLAVKNLVGDMAADITMDFPLLNDLPLDQFNIDVRALLTGVEGKNLTPEYSISNGQLFLALDKTALRLDGPVALNGVPLTVAIARAFSRDVPSTYKIKADLNDLSRTHVPPLNQPFIRGDTPLTLEIEDTKNTMRIKGVWDLTAADIGKNDANWEKSRGTPATVAFDMEKSNKALTLHQLVAKGSRLNVSLSGALHPVTYQPINLSLKQVQLGRNDFRGTVVASDKKTAIKLEGKTLDLSGMTSSGKKSTKTGQLLFDGFFNELYLTSDTPLRMATVRLDYDRGRERSNQMDLSATTAHQVPLRMTVKMSEAGKRVFNLRSSDAGGAFAALGISDKITAGDMRIFGTFDDTMTPPVLRGNIDVRDFRVAKAPTLGKILNISSLSGLVDTLRGDGIQFKRMVGAFTYTDDLLWLDNVESYSDSIGITVQGNIDRRGNVVDVQGSVAPAYTLNKVLGEIPFIGQILTGGGAQDIFAANYAVRGTLDEPEVTVNPLSVLTPGVLREIFRRDIKPIERDPETEQGTDTTPPEKGA